MAKMILTVVIGYLLGSAFSSYITKFDHWVAFVLLGIIGINMLKEVFTKLGIEEMCADSWHWQSSTVRT